MANKRRPKKLTNVWLITQSPNETLESYTKRFTIAYSCVTNPDEDFAIQAFTTWVNNESVQYVLCGADVTNMEELIAKAQKLSETQEMRRSWTPYSQSYDQNKVEQNHNS